MNYDIRGDTLTVHTDHEAGTVRVTRTGGATLAEFTLAEASEAGDLLHRALRLAATNPEPVDDHPHPFTLA